MESIPAIDWRQLGTRCDLNGLLRDGKKYHVNLQEEYTVEKISTISRQLSLGEDEACSDLNFQDVAMFAWHKTINVFAGGETTAIFVKTHSATTGDSSSFVNTFDHTLWVHASCEDAILATEGNSRGAAVCRPSLVDSTLLFHDLPVSRVEPCQDSLSVHFRSGLDYTLTYADELFPSGLMIAFCEAFEMIIERCWSAPSTLLKDLHFITPCQSEALDQWNATDGNYEKSLRLNNLIERSCKRTPDNIAVVYKDRKLTFRQLNERANQLAHYLRENIEVADEQVIGLFLAKSELLIIVVFAIWKAGAAYTPIDTSYPDERCRYSLEDTGTKLLITTQAHSARAARLSSANPDLRILVLDQILQSMVEELDKSCCRNLDLVLDSNTLCYLTYTSGTTGQPKGIRKRHTAIVNSITDIADRYKVKDEREAVVLFSPYVFEPFARQTLIALANSQTLVVVDDDEKLDPVAFEEILRRERITYLNGTASVLLEYDYSRCPDLKRLVLVGEDLTQTRYQALRKKFDGTIINEYGFTESAFVTAIKIFESTSTRPNRSLGRPLRNVKCYVLDSNLRRLPPGAIGGLYIGGQGIAEGYWNRPELTAERFLPNPFQTAEEKREGRNRTIYYTGDLARCLPGINEVEYCGRIDHQIKLRGVRIEPGEIEAILSTHEHVDRAVVIARPAQGMMQKDDAAPTIHLLAYYVGIQTAESELLSFLEAKLPRYMVPTRIIKLDRIPVTINGKIDFRALPTVALTPLPSTSRVRPSGEQQTILCSIWSELLSIPQDSFGITDSFFRLGGNSIVALQLIGRIRKTLHCRITVEQIFAAKTIQNMELELQPEAVGTEAAISTHLSVAGIADDCEIYLANSLQQGFVYHSLKNGTQDAAYTMQTVCSYLSDMNVARYEQAWRTVLEQTSALRVRFVSRSRIYQVVDKKATLDFRFIRAVSKQSLDDLMQQDLLEPYDLEVGPLFRVYLVSCYDSHFKMLLSIHHAIIDGWSVPTLLDRVHETYLGGYIQGLSLIDDAYRQAQHISAALRESNLAYWRSEVDSISERCDLRGLVRDDMRYKINLNAYDSIEQQHEQSTDLSQIWAALRQACSANDIMLHTVLQFVAHKVIQAYGNGKQSVIGTIVSGRDLPVDGIEEAIGLFINTLPFVVDHEDLRAKTVLQGLETVQQKSVSMNGRSSVELGKLTPGKMAHELFDCLLVLENYPALDKAKRRELAQSLNLKIQGTSEKLSYPLCFVFTQDEEAIDLVLTVRYAAELFTADTIADILDVFVSVLRQVADKLHQPISSLEFLGERQLARLSSWNQSNVDYPRKTLDVLFEEVVEESPSKLAVIYENDQLTYCQLNKKANQLARLLRDELEARPDCMIALLLEKNVNMFVALLAVWKAGCAWVPISSTFPAERISYILQDTQAAAIIVEESLLDSLGEVHTSSAKVLPVKTTIAQSHHYSAENLVPISCCTDRAYIFYTSGTTGKPKGVEIEHQGVVNLQRSLCKTFGLRETHDEVILSFSNYTFDHFVEQMTDALITGQTLLVLNDEMRADKDRLYAYITKHRVTYLSGTPSVVSMYDYDRFPWLRRIDCVGEDFSEPVFNKIRKGFNGCIINGYGPTETSITTHKRLYLKGERRVNKSIGHQIDNSRTYVLNADMTMLPIGSIGEMYLGGDGVGRGYLNRPELTAERFPKNPYQSAEDKIIGRDSRLYKTGDLVRWLPNGEIEYLGRSDQQIKLRGQRVEIGEIESAITSCTSIVQSVVVLQSKFIGDAVVATKYLVGYFVSSIARAEVDVKNELRAKLPEHLIPNRIVQIDTIPVTVSGKLDSKRLPTVDYATGTVRVSPENETETQLCSIWSAILGLHPEEISVVEHFVTLGGDSLLSTKLAFEMSHHFSRRVTVADIFKHRTIRALATYILESCPSPAKDGHDLPSINNVSGRASLQQERILFIDKFMGGTNAYNVLKYLEIPSTTSYKLLEEAVRLLIKRHEALRTRLLPDPSTKHTIAEVLSVDDAIGNGCPFSRAQARTQADLDYFLDQEAQYMFDLQRQSPVRIALLEVQSPSMLVMAWNIHHTALDAWSWSVLQRDLATMYNNLASNAAPDALYPLHYSQTAHSEKQRMGLRSARGEELKGHWVTKARGFGPVDLPTDFPRPSTFDHTGDDLKVQLDRATVDEMNLVAKKIGVTPFTIFCVVYCLMLRTYTNQDDIIIGIPVANRDDPGIQQVVGCFINMVFLRIQIDPHASIADLLEYARVQLEDAYAHQAYPFEELVRTLQIENSPDRHPIFRHVFSSDIITAMSPEGPADQLKWQPREYMPKHHVYSSAKVDLSTTVSAAEGQTFINFNFPTALFRRETVQQYADTYRSILSQVLTTDTRVSSLILTGRLCKQSLPVLLGNGVSDSDADNVDHAAMHTGAELQNVNGAEVVEKCLDGVNSLSELFEYWSQCQPHACAAVSPVASITYSELHQRVVALGNSLYRQGVHRTQFIGLMLGPSVDMIVCILALWQLGVGYVPMDPASTPEERLKLMVDETKPSAIITTSPYQEKIERISNCGILHIYLDHAATQTELRRLSTTTKLYPAPCGDSTAYCIFTSGSTGRPKGCVVPQRAVLSFMKAVQQRYFNMIDTIKSVLMVSNFIFDFSVEQFALSFMAGNTIVLLPDGITGGEDFYRYIDREGLYISGTPSLLSQLDFGRLPGLEMVTAAGEQLHPPQYARIRQGFSGPINNAYGCTETTVYNLVKTFLSPQDVFVNSLGDPLPGQRAYVINSASQLLPPGAVGELVLTGDCITDGYLERADLTRDRFVANPFSQESPFRTMYRTGDVVRRLPNGDIEFRGRADTEVKIRGYRIDLSEVQNVLSKHENVADCIVLPKNRSDAISGKADFIVAYFTSSSTSITTADLSDHCRSQLPMPFVPSFFVQVQGHFPTTATGKLDVAGLPSWKDTRGNGNRATAHRAPSTTQEVAMCDLWSKVLSTRVGLDDDFFRLGGDSIMSLMVSRDAYETCGIPVTVKDIFEGRTVARILEKASVGKMSTIQTEPGVLEGPAPLLPIQKWFFAKDLLNPDHWNQTFVIKTPALDTQRLSSALNQLAFHHDALRLSFRRRKGVVLQTYRSSTTPSSLVQIDGDKTKDVVSALNKLQEAINITDRLWAAAYIHSANSDESTVWFTAHHLILDTESWRILSRDLEALYNGGALPPKTSSFRQWSERVDAYSVSSTERKYWETVNDMASKLSLPFGQRQPLQSLTVTLAPHETSLVAAPSTENVTAQDVILTAFSRAVYDWAQSPVAIAMEGHGRDGLDGLDVSRTVGWFTTMYPFIAPYVQDLSSHIKAIAEARRQVPNNAIGFGTYGYEDLPLVSFNYLGRIMINSSNKTSWKLESGMNAAEWGRSRGDGHQIANNCVLDVTAWMEDGSLKIQIDGLVDIAILQRLSSKLEEHLIATVRLLSKERTNETIPGNFVPYFEFNEEPRQGPTVFLFPPGEGGAESYFHNLVTALGDVHLVVFNNIHLDHPQPNARFEDLARLYISWMRRVQPQGPYHLVGWSFGGVLAFEVALQLDRAGDTVGLLSMIDSYFDVAKISETIGHAGQKDILDPINWYYRPEPDDATRMSARVQKLVLFKAGLANERPRTNEQKKLFRWYDESKLNGLDAIVGAENVRRVLLTGQTHYTWVHDTCTVNVLADMVRGHINRACA